MRRNHKTPVLREADINPATMAALRTVMSLSCSPCGAAANEPCEGGDAFGPHCAGRVLMALICTQLAIDTMKIVVEQTKEEAQRAQHACEAARAAAVERQSMLDDAEARHREAIARLSEEPRHLRVRIADLDGEVRTLRESKRRLRDAVERARNGGRA